MAYGKTISRQAQPVLQAGIQDGRTQIGNRVDEALSRGIAKEIMKRCFQTEQKIWDNVRKLPYCGRNIKARERHNERLLKCFAPHLIGAARSPNQNRLSWVCTAPFDTGGQSAGRINHRGIEILRYDIHHDLTAEQEHAPLTIAKLDIHAMSRMIYRAGVSNYASMMEEIRGILPWCEYAALRGKSGNFLIPNAKGLFAVEYGPDIFQAESARLFGKKGHIEKVLRIKTFMGDADLLDYNQEAKEVLSRAMASVQPQRYPTVRNESFSEHRAPILDLMLDFGRRWEIRRDEAIQKRCEYEARHAARRHKERRNHQRMDALSAVGLVAAFEQPASEAIRKSEIHSDIGMGK